MRIVGLLLFLFGTLWGVESFPVPELMNGWEKLAQPVGDFDLDVEGYVEGVDVVSGCYHASSLDWEANSIDPQRLERHYFKGNDPDPVIYSSIEAPNLKGWYFRYNTFLILSPSECEACVASRSGGLLFMRRANRHQPYRIPYPAGYRGYTNDGTGILSGQTHQKNLALYNCGEEYALSMADGTVRIYHKKQRVGPWSIDEREMPQLYRSTLKEVRLPSGNRQVFRGGRWVTVSKNGQTELNWYRFALPKHESQPVRIETSDQRVFEYHADARYQMRNGYPQYFLGTYVRPDKTEIHYHYEMGRSQNDFLKKIELPEGRFLRIHHTQRGHRDYMVASLTAPIGIDGKEAQLYRFVYGQNYTEVYDACENRVRYEYDDDKRIGCKVEWDGERVVRRVRSTWYPDGSLKARVLMDGEWKVVLARRFHYDERGNVTCEQIFGNLTGKNPIPVVLDSCYVPIENGADCYTKRYSYYPGPLNLLKHEEDDWGATEYRYVEGTHLLSAKLVSDRERIVLRQFREYDQCAALTSLIEDNGGSESPDDLTGCTIRRIKRIQNRVEGYGVGLPEVTEERYWDFSRGEEVLIKKTIYHYNCHNECVQEDVCNESGEISFSIFRKFDAMGRCIFETDPDGGEYHKKYDANGNLIKEIGPNPERIIEHGYDRANRRLWTREHDGKDQERTTHFRYDHKGNLRVEIDAGGNETRYEYDDLGRRIAKILPPTPNGADHLVSYQSTAKYDAGDNIIEAVDERGEKTEAVYNTRGQPLIIRGQGEERFYYDLRGNCVEKIDACGTCTCFTYDFLDRITNTKTYDCSGTLLTSTSNTYNAFVLTSTTDGEGHTTYFHYDGAGRERCVLSGERRTEKAYDFLGRVCAIKDWYGVEAEAYTLKRTRHDFRGNIVEESSEDSQGILYEKRSYRYNHAGYQIESTTYTDLQTPHTTTTGYDIFGRPITITDPLGNAKKVFYRDDLPNHFYQKTPYKKEIDAHRNVTESYFDARNQMIHFVCTNPLGECVTEQEFRYDGRGNLVERRDRQEGDRWQILQFRYTREGKCRQLIEHGPEEDQRETFFTYDLCGRLIRKSNQQALHCFEYDPLGRVTIHVAESVQSPSVTTTYCYDRNGRVLEAKQNGVAIQRTYDPHGNILSERQGAGHEIHYQYDHQGRRILLTLPDQSRVRYRYRGPHLFRIEREDASQRLLYAHTYQSRDLSGKITTSALIGKGGELTHHYDPLGRVTAIRSPRWSQKLHYDAVGNLTRSEICDPAGNDHIYYRYDARSQLVREGERNYRYDGLGNRLDGEIGPYNQLRSGDGSLFVWGPQGNISQVKGRKSGRCHYDALGRLIQYNDTTYTYDAYNRRLSKKRTTYLYDGDHEIGSFSKSGKLIELRILAEGRGADIGAAVAIEIRSKWYAPIHDVQGSMSALIDSSSGKLVEHYRYTAFGEGTTFAANGIAIPFSFTENPWRFSSKREDVESGWIFFGRRHYIPSVARWTTIDPGGYIDGPNLYAYVHNNPLTHYDLYGFYDERHHHEPSQRCADYIGRVFRAAMSVVEWIGKNLIPLPGIRDIVEGIGRMGAGGKLLELPEYRQSQCEVAKVEGRHIEGHTFMYVNGVRTTKEEAIAIGELISQLLRGVEVYVLYNSTNGLAADLLECCFLKVAGLGNPERQIIHFVRERLSENPNEVLHVFAHSQGGLHTYNAGLYLEQRERDQMNVMTFGSAKLIPERMFGKATNFVSGSDIVPLFDFFNYTRALIGVQKNVYFLSPSSIRPIHEHGIANPTYRAAIKIIAKSFISEFL